MTEVKTLENPEGRTFKLGRNKPLVVGPHLRLDKYMLRKFPSPPPAISYITAAKQFLSDILGNDANGDCTCAAAFHISGLMQLNAGRVLDPTYVSQTVLDLYYKLTGGADSGLDEQTVFNWWQNHGLTSNNVDHRIAARVFVDPTDKEQVAAALWLFENLYLTASLPDAWIKDMPDGDGFTWGIAGAANPQNGHAFCGVAYTAAGIGIDTWGLIGTLTWNALEQYCNQKNGGGCYAVIAKEAINLGSQKAPNGFNWTQLLADVASFHV